MALASLVMPFVGARLDGHRRRRSRPGRAGPLNAGPHGFTEILYAFTSAANNNGSAFAGISANTPLYNIIDAVAMLLGRFFIIDPGARASPDRWRSRRPCAATAGTLPHRQRRCSSGCCVGVIVIVGALTFFPVVSLGPIVEHLSHGKFF